MPDDYDLKPRDPNPSDTPPRPHTGDVVHSNTGPLDLAPVDTGPLELAPHPGKQIPVGTDAEITPQATAAPLELNTTPTTTPATAATPNFTPPVPIIEPPDADEDDPAPIDPPFDPHDIERYKGLCIIGYIPPLFVIPLLIAPHSRVARYHANQGLLLFIIAIACMLASTVLELCNYTLVPIIDSFNLGVLAWLGGCIAHVGAVFLIVLIAIMAIFGIVSAANGEAKPLPLIGKYVLIR